jgi:hypothetical protein
MVYTQVGHDFSVLCSPVNYFRSSDLILMAITMYDPTTTIIEPKSTKLNMLSPIL